MHVLLLALGVWVLLSLVVGLFVARVLRGFAAAEAAEVAARAAIATDTGSIDRPRRPQPTPAEPRTGARARLRRRVS